MECLTESGAVRILTGVLAVPQREEVEAHLTRCDLCIRMLGEAAQGTETEELSWLARLRPALLQTGTVVAERYRIVRSLGSGAMGEVHEAEDQLLAKVVALKTLNATLTGRPGAIARLKSEVTRAHRVTHPNVCRIFDFGIDEPADRAAGAFVFLTMEYLPGETVAELVRRRGKLPATEAVSLLTQIAAGLAAAHEVGVVHRDLKSENVILVEHPDRGLRAVITDFGLAGSVEPERSTARASGTFELAAPERLAGRPATPTSDVYSFGLLTQQLLTGRLPTVASSAAVAAALRLGERLASEGPATAAFGPAWDRFVLRTLHPEPAYRYQNGSQLLAALRALSPQPAPPPPPRPWRQMVGIAAIITLAVLAAVAMARRGTPHATPAPLTTGAPPTIAAPAPAK